MNADESADKYEEKLRAQGVVNGKLRGYAAVVIVFGALLASIALDGIYQWGWYDFFKGQGL